MEVIPLSGEVSRQTEQGLWRQISPALARQPRSILLDFSDVHYMAISSIAILIDLLVLARRSSVTVAACGLQEPFMRLLDLSQLSSEMEIYPQKGDAIRRWSEYEN